jgi:hypothetical protein
MMVSSKMSRWFWRFMTPMGIRKPEDLAAALIAVPRNEDRDWGSVTVQWDLHSASLSAACAASTTMGKGPQ